MTNKLPDLAPRDMAALSIFLEVNGGSEDKRCAGCGANETTDGGETAPVATDGHFVVHGGGWTSPELGGDACES
jgi:hypothetical protein